MLVTSYSKATLNHFSAMNAIRVGNVQILIVRFLFKNMKCSLTHSSIFSIYISIQTDKQTNLYSLHIQTKTYFIYSINAYQVPEKKTTNILLLLLLFLGAAITLRWSWAQYKKPFHGLHIVSYFM